MMINVENRGRVLLGKPFDRDKQECMTGHRGNLAEMAFRRHQIDRELNAAIHLDRIPDSREHLVQSDSRVLFQRDQVRLFDEGLQGGGYIGIAPRLSSRQDERISAEIRYMLDN